SSSSFVEKSTDSTPDKFEIAVSISATAASSVSSAINDLISTSFSRSSATLFRFIMIKTNTPTNSKVTVTALTDAKVIQPLRPRLFKLSRKWRNNVLAFISVVTSSFVTGDKPAFDCNYAVSHCIYDFAVVCSHHYGCTASVDAFEKIHNIP